jgi:hypothetical protein
MSALVSIALCPPDEHPAATIARGASAAKTLAHMQTIRLRQAELTPRDHDRAAADLDAL